MPVKHGDVEIIGDDGKFTDKFNPGMLGEEYKDSKFFENTPDVMSAIKRGLDNHMAIGKKLEGHIAPLGKDPTEEQVAAHRTALMSAVGTVVEKPENYELTKPEDWPEQLPYNEERSTHFATFLHGRGWPKEDVQALVAEFDKQALIEYSAFAEAEKTKFDDAVVEYKSENKGDALIKKTRTAAKAMVQFATAELAKEIKAKDLITNPGNFEAWRELDVSMDQLRVWSNIGSKMKSNEAIGDESSAEEKATKNKMGKLYDHETSKSMT